MVVGIDEGGATPEGLTLCLGTLRRHLYLPRPGKLDVPPENLRRRECRPGRRHCRFGKSNQGWPLHQLRGCIRSRGHAQRRGRMEVRDQVRAYFDKLLAAGDALRRLDEALIEQLAAEGWVTSERTQNARRSRQSSERVERERLFGKAVEGLAGAPFPEVAPLAEDEEDEDTVPPAPCSRWGTAAGWRSGAP